MRRVKWRGAAILLGIAAGCSSAPTSPLESVDFYAPQRRDEAILSQPQARRLEDPPAPATREAVRPTAQLVPRRVVAVSTTMPATTQSASSGEFMTLGGIVAVINGKPIYAGRVLTEVRSALKANAAEMDREEYEKTAKAIIDNQIRSDVKSELLIVLAQRKLDDKDRKLADQLTERWRQDQITQAGGSVEMARRATVDIAQRYNREIGNPLIPPLQEDFDFEQMVQEVHWRYIVEIYTYRRVSSRVDPTAAEMRDYYARNLDRQFTDHARARFRVIQIDPEKAGGRDAAITKVGNLLRRALAGEDFARLARENCSDVGLANKAGDMGWIDRGSLRYEKVEKAVWDTPVGEIVKEPVEDQGTFYLIKVEAKASGGVKPFEEARTQEVIRSMLSRSQSGALFQSLLDELAEDSVKTIVEQNGLTASDKTLNTAVEIAMQLYAAWHKSNRQVAAPTTMSVGEALP